MAITSICPGCGASLSINETQQSVTCQFCGNHFNVNLEETSPAFQKATQPDEPQPAPSAQPASANYNPPIPGKADNTADDLYNPPIPGAPGSPRQDVYNPTLQDISSGPDQPYTPPPLNAPAEQPLINRLTGSRLWVGIAIAVTVIFCISCLCMAAIARGLFQ